MRHPLHPMLAHFPVTCWSLTTLADLAGLRYGQPAWQLAGTLLWIGLLMALPTVVAGIFQLIRVPDEAATMRTTYLHMALMMLAFALYLATFLMRVDSQHIHAPDAAALAVSAAGLVVLLVGGWLGGSLVYGHGVGRPESA